jgi:hypothetical protein
MPQLLNGAQYTKGKRMPYALASSAITQFSLVSSNFMTTLSCYYRQTPDATMADVSSDAGASPNADTANNTGRTASRLRAACNECHASKVLTSYYKIFPCFACHVSIYLSTQPSHSVNART